MCATTAKNKQRHLSLGLMPRAAIDMFAVTRLVLLISALLIIYFDPAGSGDSRHIVRLAFAFYAGFSYVLFSDLLRRNGLARFSPWVDVGWFTLFFVLGSGANPIIYFGFFFAILITSFCLGLASVLSVALGSAVIISALGFALSPAGMSFKLSVFLLSPIVLVALGSVIANRGSYELMLKRQLLLLKKLNTLSNPRFGVDHTIGLIMERLRVFYDADTCLLITTEADASEYHLRYADRGDPEKAAQAKSVADELARQLIALPSTHAVVYSRPLREWLPFSESYHEYEISSGARKEGGREISEAVACALGAESFITVPVLRHHNPVGRIYLTAARRRAFHSSDADFLYQVVEQFMPVIENMRLVDRLASDAAEQERQKISRDIHDSVIQPYIAIQMGLVAVRQKLEIGASGVTGDIQRLINMTDLMISGLRHYVGGLAGGGGHEAGLVPAVQRFAAKFSSASGIEVEVKSETEVKVNDRLAAEAFQMVTEGLSNIRRHTDSRKALVQIERCRERFLMHIGNECSGGSVSRPFIPRSITGRAAALGGRVQVEQAQDGWTVINIEIPL